jgi:hypothetical protein
MSATLAVPYGFCHCGCGQRTALVQATNRNRGEIKGQPNRFVNGHNSAGESGSANRAWKGGRFIAKSGYVHRLSPDHPRAVHGYVLEHVLVAEAALGKSLPLGVEVHHVDENRSNNANDNLVVCQDRHYHALLHRRARALAACGNPNAHRCHLCAGYDNQSDIRLRPRKNGQFGAAHGDCIRASQRRQFHARKELAS